MTKWAKALAALLASAISVSCLSANAYAALDPNDYASINAQWSEKLLLTWDEEIYYDIQFWNINADEEALTFSEPYCYYDFYDMTLNESRSMRIVYENDQIIALSFGNLYKGKIYTQYYSGEYEYLAEALENNGKILFGCTVVNGLPCALIYADGTIYAHNTVALEEGPTDLVFGEIPYSEHNSGMEEPDDSEESTTATTTEPVTKISVGDLSGDNNVSLMDVIYLQKMITGTLEMNEENKTAADCCADGILNAADTAALLQFVIRAVDALPVIPE